MKWTVILLIYAIRTTHRIQLRSAGRQEHGAGEGNGSPLQCSCLEKAMTAHSSVLAWRIPGTAEPGGLPSMGSHRVGHDRSDLTAAAWCSGKSRGWSPKDLSSLSLSVYLSVGIGKTQGPLEESPQHKLNECLGLLQNTTLHPHLSTCTCPPLTMKHHFP